jgi:hypothetical protein
MHQAKKTINDERIARGSEAYFGVKEKKKKETDKLDQTRSKVCLYSLAIKKIGLSRIMVDVPGSTVADFRVARGS